MIGAMSSGLRLLGIVVAGAIALAVAGPLVNGKARVMVADGRLTTSDGDTVDVSAEARAAGLTFAPGVAPGDRQWILAAVARARPEAARLIAEVDGLVRVGTYAEPGPVLGVNRDGSEILGLTTVTDVDALPEGVADLAVVCTPATANGDVLRACAAKGVRAAYVVSGGYRETGAEGR